MKNKTQDIIALAEDLTYLKGELEGENKLYGSCPDGHVTLDAMIEYCKENDHLLEHVIKVARRVNGGDFWINL